MGVVKFYFIFIEHSINLMSVSGLAIFIKVLWFPDSGKILVGMGNYVVANYFYSVALVTG